MFLAIPSNTTDAQKDRGVAGGTRCSASSATEGGDLRLQTLSLRTACPAIPTRFWALLDTHTSKGCAGGGKVFDFSGLPRGGDFSIDQAVKYRGASRTFGLH
jgi:hypothetical protein